MVQEWVLFRNSIRRRTPWLFLGLILLGLPPAQVSAFEWQGRLGRLTREFEEGDASAKRRVLRRLTSYPLDAIKGMLLSGLRNDDPLVRMEAAVAAGHTQLREAVPVLLDWLDDADPDLRRLAVKSLGGIADPRTTQPLIRALGDKSAAVRSAAAYALSQIGGAETIVPLLSRLDDEDEEVRGTTVRALAKLKDPRSVVPLIGRSRDESLVVRQAVMHALGDLGDPRGTAALVQALADPTPVQLAAIAALSRVQSARGATALIPLTRHNDYQIARASIASLGAYSGKQAAQSTDAIIAALASDAASETASAVLVRSALINPETTPRLIAEFSRTTNHRVTTALANIASEIMAVSGADDRWTAPILKALGNRGSPIVLLNAAARTGSKDGLIALFDWLNSDKSAIQRKAIEAIALHMQLHGKDGRAADPLLATLGNVHPENRVPLVTLIGRVGAKRALPTLRPLLESEDSNLRSAALQAIGRIGAEEGGPAVQELIDDEDGRTRFEAGLALGRSASPEILAWLASRVENRKPIDRHAHLVAVGEGLKRLSERGELTPELEKATTRMLTKVVGGSDDQLVARGLDATAHLPEGSALAVISQALKEGRGLARTHAIRMLAFHPSGVQLLESSLSDRHLATFSAAALGEHGTAEMFETLATQDGPPWPFRLAVSFAALRMAKRGVLGDKQGALVCKLLDTQEPFQQANALLALSAANITTCKSHDPDTYRQAQYSPRVRAAALRWKASLGSGDSWRSACNTTDAATKAVCASPKLSSDTDTADVYAFDPSGRSAFSDKWVGLALSDGSVLVTRSDPNAHLSVPGVPKGSMTLINPFTQTLGP